MSIDKKITLLKKSDLLKTIGHLIVNSEFPHQFIYADEFDYFNFKISQSNLGFSVSCWLNNSCSYQLNGMFFSSGTLIGVPLLIASNAPVKSRIEEFFNIDLAEITLFEMGSALCHS